MLKNKITPLYKRLSCDDELNGKSNSQPILYTDLIVTEKLFHHLEEIDTACRERLEIIEKAVMQQEGVTEALKAVGQMAWGALHELHPQ